ncbi:MAG TPA: VOC family protein [Nitrobacter sp.]|jgi:predicted 3-demethylubiquinone-9 3-methyltransferase (glyoxalase superfamily)|nr:VOC family protein [Nitrobacter sp.]
MQPFLMFQGGHAEKAMDLYVSLFDDGEILDVMRWRKGEPGAEGSIKLARFRAAGQCVVASDSPVEHAFDFTPSWSFFVDCASGEEQERLCTKLSEGGTLLMPLDDYGFSKRFAWIADRFGVSWQLNLS